ncbi:hypothetical protein RSAG8_00409, partial [Rhizoctonia solani AG-8 WAC10335]
MGAPGVPKAFVDRASCIKRGANTYYIGFLVRLVGRVQRHLSPSYPSGCWVAKAMLIIVGSECTR